MDGNKNGVIDGVPTSISSYGSATTVTSPGSFTGIPKNHPAMEGGVLSPQQSLEKVIASAGASLPARVAPDDFVIGQLLSYGTEGALITHENNNGIYQNVGVVSSGSRPVDSDNDGIPDAWETANGSAYETVATLPASAVSYDVTGLPEETSYYFRIVTRNGVMESSPSEILKVATEGTPRVPFQSINPSPETPSTIAGANLGETGDAFYVAYRTEDKEKKVYSIQVSETDAKCMEVNDTRTETDVELANTVQFNNAYADRARFRWVIEDVNSTGFNPVDSEKVILSVEYIDLLGKRVVETTEGILIKKIRYTDGTGENKKVFLIK